MAMLTVRNLILAKIETTYGTDPVPTTAANAVEAFNIVLTPQSTVYDRRPHGVTMSRPQMLNSKKKYQIKFDVELKGSGTAGTAPRIGPLLRCCGLGETIVAVTSVTYAPVSTSFESATLYVYKDGILYKMLGCVGDVEFVFEAGKPAIAKFTIDSLYTIPADTAFPSSYTLDTTVPVVVQNASFTFGSYSAVADKLTLALKNTISTRESINGAAGIAGYQIVDRNPEGDFTPEAVLRATSNADFWLYWDTPASKALSLVLGATAGNITTVTAPVCYEKEVKTVDQNKIENFDIPFQLAKSAATGNDELSIALT